MKSMRIRMLQSIAGQGFALSGGDITDRFPEKEAKRLVSAGMAEVAPPEPVKKPETKKEWDDERAALLAENADLTAENEALKVREAELIGQIEVLSAFKISVVAALGTEPVSTETTVVAQAPEVRG
jgi:F-type H+-transporting ATPase subunit b